MTGCGGIRSQLICDELARHMQCYATRSFIGRGQPSRTTPSAAVATPLCTSAVIPMAAPSVASRTDSCRWHVSSCSDGRCSILIAPNQRRHESASSLCSTDVDIPSSRPAWRQSAERKRRPGCRHRGTGVSRRAASLTMRARCYDLRWSARIHQKTSGSRACKRNSRCLTAGRKSNALPRLTTTGPF